MAHSHPTLIRNGPALLAARAATPGRIVERLLSSYTDGDSLAVITVSTVAGPLAMTAADFALAAGASNAEVLTIGATTHTLTSEVGGAGAPTPYRAIVDTVTGEVLFVGQSASIGGDPAPWGVGGQVTCGPIVLTFQQPETV